MPARILIIEDDETSLGLMAYLFQAFGYAAALARDSAEGLREARRASWDLIICDLDLPGIDGYQVARQLKRDPALAAVPLVTVTALAMVGEREKALRAGFDGYIPKPIAPEKFVSQIEAFLRPDQRSGRVPEAAGPAEPETGPRPRRRATVLVLDDSPVNLSLIRGVLEPSGYETLTTQDPDEALQLAGKKSPDVILSDVHMPALSGYEFVRRLKSDPRLEQTPLILMTSSSSPREAVPYWDASLESVRVMPRPAEPERLLREIEKCLAGARGYGNHSGRG